MIEITRFTTHGKILMAALDHRGSFEKLLERQLGRIPSKKEMIVAKKRIIKAVFPYASGILLDPDFGLPAYQQFLKESGEKAKPYLLCIEKSGYESEGDERLTELVSTVDELKYLGASGVKILLFFHPHGKTASYAIRLIQSVILDCKKAELPFFFEFLTYPVPNEQYETSRAILESIDIFSHNGIFPDVYKLEYPGDGNSCKEITRKVGRIPWILLTKGADYSHFKSSVDVASKNGVSGFLAGRSLWQEFADVKGEEQEHFFKITVPERFKEIENIILNTL